jgi:hypothetical protein
VTEAPKASGWVSVWGGWRATDLAHQTGPEWEPSWAAESVTEWAGRSAAPWGQWRVRRWGLGSALVLGLWMAIPLGHGRESQLAQCWAVSTASAPREEGIGKGEGLRGRHAALLFQLGQMCGSKEEPGGVGECLQCDSPPMGSRTVESSGGALETLMVAR